MSDANNIFEQSNASVDKNIDFFNENEAYMRAQEKLEIYQLIRLTVTRELKGVQSLLDVGNGGFFNYPIDSVPEIVACDLMLKDTQPAPNLWFKNGSILDLPFEDNRFDCVLEQNVLHHVTGQSVQVNIHNMFRALKECARVLKPGGKLVLVESTVPAWFYYLIEYPMYTFLSPVWPFKHPLTFQFTRQLIVQELRNLSLNIEEQTIIPRGKWVIQFGLVVPTIISPIQAMKFVAVK